MQRADYISCIQEMADCIEDTLTLEAGIEEGLKQLHYSRTHLYRIFHAVADVTPSEYRRKRRMSIAASALCLTDKRILDVAVETGFSSKEAFTRAFQREYGITPGEVRKKHCVLPLYEKLDVKKKIGEKQRLLDNYDVSVILQNKYQLTGYQALVKPGSNQIKQLWQKLMKNESQIEISDHAIVYGVCEFAPDITDNDEFVYFYGMEGLPGREDASEIRKKKIEASKYISICHNPAIRTLKETYALFYGVWLPLSGMELKPADTIERYHLQEDRLEIEIPVF